MRPSARRSVALVLLVLGPPVLLSGCATLAIPTVGSAAVGASGDALKAGASYTFGGWTYRTFSAPLVGVYGAARQTPGSTSRRRRRRSPRSVSAS